MVSSILKAGLKCPELITNLQLRWFDSKDITLAFHVLALHKPQPPIFYTQFAYNFLGRPHSLVLRDLEFTTITGFMKSISSASTAVLTLKAMCKCYILTNQKDLKKDLTFYQCKDEFYELIARGN